ncbi:MAG TPA: NADPH-dependent glutamate synthase [Candidatus Kapabacteria bacterium]|nr:NADPH-dependent glutamate synthase [Candidatus Kapabacteria bacterium]HPO63873.1 NADPH-dependent glutamate synthase [Candidatus Kapabacteria bacterium]
MIRRRQMAEMTNKERMSIKRHHMLEQDPNVRNKNFEEVNLGYTQEIAIEEANRCIQCKNPLCITGCPVSINIPKFIKLISEGNHKEAAAVLKIDNALPAVCGRVCPQEEQCEKVCILAKKGDPVAIGNLERWAADWERKNIGLQIPELKPKTGKKIAIVGGGPAGLSCAGDLIQMGHEVTVFEALHSVGGVLIYGIPEFRLPKEIVHIEIEGLAKMGVEFVTNYVVGLIETIDELLERFDAIFIGVGAGLPYFMNIPGEHLNGVYSSNEFLTRVNLMKAYKFPETDTPMFDVKNKVVAVFGGGNTAMDAVRTSLRLGAKRAMIVYRRTEAEMPARIEEIKHAKEEGVEFYLLAAPLEFLGDEQGWLRAMKLQKMELGEPDASGRRRPVPIEGAVEEISIETAVVAIGNGSNPIINQTTPDLNVNKWGNILVDNNTMKTNKKGVFAGGDIVTGGATVILAMGAGRTAAKAIDEFVKNPDTW